MFENNQIKTTKQINYDSPRNWTEDFQHENGNYQCKCCNCGEFFIGHKRRVVCKVCANNQIEVKQEEPLPCPFCGSPAIYEQDNSFHIVKCSAYGQSMLCPTPHLLLYSKEQVIEYWNRRNGS
jgi:hypothetical protein